MTLPSKYKSITYAFAFKVLSFLLISTQGWFYGYFFEEDGGIGMLQAFFVFLLIHNVIGYALAKEFFSKIQDSKLSKKYYAYHLLSISILILFATQQTLFYYAISMAIASIMLRCLAEIFRKENRQPLAFFLSEPLPIVMFFGFSLLNTIRLENLERELVLFVALFVFLASIKFLFKSVRAVVNWGDAFKSMLVLFPFVVANNIESLVIPTLGLEHMAILIFFVKIAKMPVFLTNFAQNYYQNDILSNGKIPRSAIINIRKMIFLMSIIVLLTYTAVSDHYALGLDVLLPLAIYALSPAVYPAAGMNILLNGESRDKFGVFLLGLVVVLVPYIFNLYTGLLIMSLIYFSFFIVDAVVSIRINTHRIL